MSDDGVVGADSVRVPLHDLRRKPRSRRHVVLDVVVEPITVSDTTVDPATPVHLDLVLESAAEGITASGCVTGRWVGSCNLCLEQVGGDLAADVHELFADEPLDEETYRLDAEVVDLEPMIRDALALELPLLARCPFGGVGGCDRAPDFVVGVDPPDDRDDGPLGSGDRGAHESRGDPRWAALDQLRFGDRGLDRGADTEG